MEIVQFLRASFSRIRTSGGSVFNFVLHPFLFALYPILAPLASNIEEVPLEDAYRAGLIALLAAAIGLLALTLILRNWHRAAFLTSIGVLLIASYGHIYSWLKPMTLGEFPIGRHRYLVPAIGLSLVLALWIALRIRNGPSITTTLNLAAVVAVAIPIIAIGSHNVRLGLLQARRPTDSRQTNSLLNISKDLRPPDIYYIILDAYARADVLQNRFGFDNSEFIDALKARGFYVADASETNYLRTILSVTSSLNMNYIPELGLDSLSDDFRLRLEEQLKDSIVRQQLEAAGYITVAVSTSYAPTEIVTADYYLVPNMSNIEALRAEGAFNAFESVVLTNSIGQLLLDYNTLRGVSVANFIASQLDNAKQIRREIVLAAFDHLSTISSIPGSKFIFVHIVSPHYPYLFGSNGEPLNYPEPLTFVEKQIIPGEESWTGYRDQLLYINSRLLDAIDVILENSAEPPVILVQSDHGPATGLNWADPRDPYLSDRSAILNAYFIPDHCQDSLYPEISPVNSFRVVLNCSFGSALDLLPDQSFLDVDVPGGLKLVPLDEINR